MPTLPLDKQLEILLRFLSSVNSSKSDAKLSEIIDWLKDIPPSSRELEAVKAVHLEIVRAYGLTRDEFNELLEPRQLKKNNEEFDAMVPAEGWLRDYVEYTRKTEPPTVFHFFAGLVALGSTMGRSTRYNKGSYWVYPNLCVVVVAPTGRCRKTSACNIAIRLMRQVEATQILADKTTPEALLTTFEGHDDAVGLIYAPELAVFLGRQKYQEGMVPLLTALFDCPDEFKTRTITRGEIEIRNVGLSFLGCSTLDWIQTAIPKDAFGGGFMRRLLFVVQDDTPRKFALPPPLPAATGDRLRKQLLKIQKASGEWNLVGTAREWYEHWYEKREEDKTGNAQFAGYHESKPDQLLRVAMCLAASEFETESPKLDLTTKHLSQSLKILEWLEKYLGSAFGSMQVSAAGEDRDRMLRQIQKKGGVIDHSSWLRLNSSRINATQFKGIIETLVEEKVVRRDPKSPHIYFVTKEGWS
jgi:hypothetical protein